MGFVDYGKAFDTVEHFAIFEALRKTNINEKYINILQNIIIQPSYNKDPFRQIRV